MSETPGKRLRLLREKRGWTQREMADFLGVGASAYANNENGTRGLREAGPAYARRLGVSLDWLVTGRGAPGGGVGRIAVMGMVGAGATVAAPADEGYVDPVDHVDLPNPDEVFAYVVKGDSQYPRFMDGDILIASRQPETPGQNINRTAIVETEDGEKLVKKIMRGRTPGSFTLWSHNAPEMRDTSIRAAYPILSVIVRS